MREITTVSITVRSCEHNVFIDKSLTKAYKERPTTYLDY